MNRGKVLSILVLVTIFYSFGCSERSDKAAWQMQQPVMEQLIPDKLLSQADLELLWQREMPLKKNEKLERLQLIDDRLYALSSDNYLVSLDTDNGKIIISQKLDQAGLPVFELRHYNDQLYSIIANRLVELNKNSGELIAKRNFDFGVTCPAVRNSRFFYIAGSDRRLHAFRASNKVEVFEAAAPSDSGITSIIADENFVIFSTEAGDLICLTPDRPAQLWKPFKAADGIVAPLVRDGATVFFASRDTCVYSIDIPEGTLNWKYQGGTVYNHGPVVRGDVVYQYAGRDGLAAIRRADSRLLWQLPEVVAFLAADNQKAFLWTRSKELAVMDNTDAKLLCSVDFSSVSCFATNTSDSRIYVADERGRIACLKPLKY